MVVTEEFRKAATRPGSLVITTEAVGAPAAHATGAAVWASPDQAAGAPAARAGGTKSNRAAPRMASTAAPLTASQTKLLLLVMPAAGNI